MLESFIETSRTYLLSASAPTTASERRMQTLMSKLAHHVARDDAAEIEMLLTREQNANLVAIELQKSPYSCLHHAAAQGKTKALRSMLGNLPLDVWNSRTQKKRRTPLMLAAQNGHARTIYEFYDGFHYHMRQRANLYPGTEPATLHEPHTDYGAVRARQHADQLWKAIVNAQDIDGNTPLLLAVQNNHARCCDALLTVQLTTPETKNRLDDNALSVARRLPNAEIYRALHHYIGQTDSEREHR